MTRFVASCVILLVVSCYVTAEEELLEDVVSSDVDRNTLITGSQSKKISTPDYTKMLIGTLSTLKMPRKETTEMIARMLTRTLSSLNLPSDLSMPANMLQLLASAGALVVGFIGVAVVLSLILPLFGVKLCYLLGTCDHFNTVYTTSSGPALNSINTGYDAYSTAGTYNQPALPYGSGNNYQKRSLEYVGPILQTLSAAYEKYASPEKKD